MHMAVIELLYPLIHLHKIYMGLSEEKPNLVCIQTEIHFIAPSL